MDPNDEAALEAFMAQPSSSSAGGAKQQLTLGDMILSKSREKQREAGAAVLPEDGEEDPGVPEGLDDKVVQVYRGVGKLLSR